MRNRIRHLLALAGAIVCSVLPASLPAQNAAAHAEADALAKALSNPVAALISVPFQLNYDEGYGASDDGERFTLNIQPVIPLSISTHWNVISRTILPVIEQSDVVPGDSSQSGLGDVSGDCDSS